MPHLDLEAMLSDFSTTEYTREIVSIGELVLGFLRLNEE